MRPPPLAAEMSSDSRMFRMKMDRINAYMEQCKLELGLRVEACSRDDAARKDCPDLTTQSSWAARRGAERSRGAYGSSEPLTTKS